MATTIQVTEQVKRELDEFKIHPRQSYNETIEDLIEKAREATKEIHPDVLKDIQEAREQLKRGRGRSTAEVMRRLGVSE